MFYNSPFNELTDNPENDVVLMQAYPQQFTNTCNKSQDKTAQGRLGNIVELNNGKFYTYVGGTN